MKAQSSVEFMAIFTLLLIVVIFTAVLSVQNTSRLVYSKTEMEVNKLLEYVGERIDAAYLGGHGFSSNITLPKTMLGYNYSLNISYGSNIIYVRMADTDYPWNILTGNVTGEFRYGENMIRNENGMVTIS